ncbi:MAG: TetR family transcriptional regulator C-terminal domain-containing protein [Longimicrobiales bacterium]
MNRLRNPVQTRERLLQAAFAEVYANGYTGASLDGILDTAGVTKGALYHHFGSKKALAQAMIDEMVQGMVVDSWLAPLGDTPNVIDAIQACLNVQMEGLTPEQVQCGCPLNNLAQELSASDDDFREQIDGIYTKWRAALANLLEEGIQSGVVRPDVDPVDVATFVVASMAGIAGHAKASRDLALALASVRVLCEYLDTLRAPEGSPA